MTDFDTIAEKNYGLPVDLVALTYQMGAHFGALDEGILMAPLKSFEHFLACVSLDHCDEELGYLLTLTTAF